MNTSAEHEAQERIILNFLPVETGGGLQNALSFLKTLGGDRERKHGCLAVVRHSSPIEEAARRAGIDCLTVAPGRMARVGFELRCRSTFRRGQVCFTLFGPPMLRSRGYLLNVTGCAYSNLFYPEIPFWFSLPFLKRKRKEAIDVLRKRVTAWADYWIFETEVLRRRAIEICRFPRERVGVVRMAPSQLVGPERVKPELRKRLCERLPRSFKVLYLSGAHPNKRLHLLPSVAQALCKQGYEDLVFVTTMQPTHPYAHAVIADFKARGLRRYVENIGPVASEDVATVIDCCDVMCTFSLLESFSNNFVEAWQMGVPLIVTDADWARESCADGALYADPGDAEGTAQALRELATKVELRRRLVAAGTARLGFYHDAVEKTRRYFAEIDKAVALGPCPAPDRAAIAWPRITSPRRPERFTA